MMADIDIEKRSSHGLLWSILGLAALGLLLFWLLRGANRDQVTMVEEPATEPVPTAPATVEPVSPTLTSTQQFRQQCAQGTMTATGTGSESQYASSCLNLLTSAIESSVSPDRLGSIRSQLDNARSATTQLGTTTDATTQARLTKDAFGAIAGSFETLHPTGPGHDAAEILSQTAGQISADQPLSAQASTVQQFFSQANNLLNQMPSTGI